MSKKLNDKLLSTAILLPAPGGSVTSAAIALGQEIDEFPEMRIGFQLDPITGTMLPDTEVLTATIEVSEDDGSSWAAAATVIATGSEGEGPDTHQLNFQPVNSKKRGKKILKNLSYRGTLAVDAAAHASIQGVKGSFQIEF
jgi:hypothetical protein